MSEMALFDDSAKDYDQIFTRSLVGESQRQQVWHWLEKVILPGQHILELNAGTGEDATKLLNYGCLVTVTDISNEMLEVAKQKIGDDENVSFKQLDLTKTIDIDKKYEVVLSNFGGLNCLSKSELENLSGAMHNLLKPKGKLILVLMTNSCWWEQLYFALKGEFKKVNQRKSNKPIMVPVEGAMVPTYFYSVKALKSFFASHFHVKKVKPIGLLTPPSYLNPLIIKLGVFGKWLLKLDAYIARISLLANKADHVYVELERK